MDETTATLFHHVSDLLIFGISAGDNDLHICIEFFQMEKGAIRSALLGMTLSGDMGDKNWLRNSKVENKDIYRQETELWIYRIHVDIAAKLSDQEK